MPPPTNPVDPLSRLIEKRSDLSSQVSPDAAELLLEAARDEGGIILRVGTMEGLEISTNNRDFNEDKSARSEARWEGAIEELIKQRLVQDKGNKGEVFAITKLGYQVVDSLGG